MELVEQLKSDGIAKGLCRMWQMKLRSGMDIEELVGLYIKGIDFCISEDFPTLDFLREHFRGRCEPFGVFVDDDIAPADTRPDMVLNGGCRAMLEYDGYSVSRLYVRHTSEVAVVALDDAYVTVDMFDSARLHLSVVGDARVIVNVYGCDVAIEYIGDDTPDKVKVTYHDKKAY